MKAFEFNFKGKALGGVAVVLADDAGLARTMLASEIGTPLALGAELVSETGQIRPGVLYLWDGDY